MSSYVRRYASLGIASLIVSAIALSCKSDRDFGEGNGARGGEDAAGAPASGGSESSGGTGTSPGDGGKDASSAGSPSASGGEVAAAGSGASGCEAPRLDCDGSGECATDGDSDADHCGDCETRCFQQCRSGVCADPVRVSVGLTHACALLSDGSVWCWGSNFWGELGPDRPDGATAPVRISLPQRATAVQAGGLEQAQGDPLAVSCALLEDETVRCWGAGKALGLGNGLVAASAEPVEVKGVGNVVQLSHSGGQGCAVTGGGKLYCWGLNDEGQVGNGTKIDVGTPVSVLSGVNQVSCAGEHTCARLSNGDLYCWGSPSSGKLGISNLPSNTSSPLVVPGMNDTTEVAVAFNHTLARKGAITYGWGHDYSGQVNGTFSEVTTPVQVDIAGEPPAAKRVIAGSNVSAVIGSDDLLTVWGSAFHGDGEGATGYAPAKIDVGAVIEVSFGSGASDSQTVCVIKANHELNCWGSDTYGQVGNDDPVAEVRTPEPIAFDE